VDINSVKLVYFSPTRTTKKVLQGIAQALDVATVEHHDLSLPNAKVPLCTGMKDVLTIIGAPVYGGRIPTEAQGRLRLLSGGHTMAVIVVVYGNREYEDALLELTNLAEGAGFKPIAGGAFIGEHSFSTEAAPIANGRPDTKDIEKALEFGRKIQEKVRTIHKLDDISALSVPGKFPYQEQKRAAKTIPVTRATLCTQCEKCTRICPTAAVTVSDGVTTDPDICILCCACVRNCPSGARVFADARIKETAEWLSKNCRERKEPETYF
jgi:ferredoxin